jgi:hypothetical protein
MHNSKKELNSLLFEINNCNIFNGLINIFNEQEDNIVFYVETIKGDAEIYYLNSINNHTEFLNIFQDLNNYYSYPFESNSKYIILHPPSVIHAESFKILYFINFKFAPVE